MDKPIPFAGNPLDRAANLRRNADWIAEQLASPSSRFLPVWRLTVLTDAAAEAALYWCDSSVCRSVDEGSAPVFLGLRDGIAHFAVDLSPLADPITDLGLPGARFSEPRAIATMLPAGEAGIVAQGRALLDWHRRHRYCGVCGSLTAPAEGGYVRRCAQCAAEHFPRTDPVVIMVVWRGERCLLGRRAGAAENLYSTLAGFIDQGETIEEAVRREVFEEIGIPVDDVSYHSSLPWPFPSSLMIGCFAHSTSDRVQVDPHEVADARWFSRDEIQTALDAPAHGAPFRLPGEIAIARYLIRAWAQWS